MYICTIIKIRWEHPLVALFVSYRIILRSKVCSVQPVNCCVIVYLFSIASWLSGSFTHRVNQTSCSNPNMLPSRFTNFTPLHSSSLWDAVVRSSHPYWYPSSSTQITTQYTTVVAAVAAVVSLIREYLIPPNGSLILLYSVRENKNRRYHNCTTPLW